MKKLMSAAVIVLGLVCVSLAGDVSGSWEYRSLGADQYGGGSIELWMDTGHTEVQTNGTYTGNGSSHPGSETWTQSGTVSDLGDGLVRIQGSDGTNSWDVQKFVTSAGDFVYSVEVEGLDEVITASGLVKTPDSSSVADMAGEWRCASIWSDASSTYWDKATLTAQPDGVFSVSFIESDGGSGNGTGTVVQTGTGLFDVHNAGGDVDMSLAMNASKDILINSQYNDGECGFEIVLKKGTNYQQSDLTGKWRIASFYVDPLGDTPAGGDSVVITVADDGSFSGIGRDAGAEDEEEVPEAISGTLSIAADGTVTVNTGGADPFELFLNAGKNTLAGCYTDDGDIVLDIALKAAETDPSQAWVQDGRLIKARDQFAAGLIGGKIYAFGGNESYTGDDLDSIETYDPSTRLPVYGTNHPSLYVEEMTGAEYAGDFYCFGAWGYADGDWDSLYRNINLRYNTDSESWTTLAFRPDICSGASCAVVYDDEIFVFGGRVANTTNSIPSQKIHAYNPATDSWRYVTDIPQPVAVFGLARVGNLAYLIGGWNWSSEQVVRSIMTYNFDTGVWTQNAGTDIPLPARVFTYQHTLPVFDGKIYCVGGNISEYEYTDQVDVYDTASDTWSAGPDLPVSTAGHCVLEENGSIYVVGGTIGYDSITDEEILTDNIWRWDVAELPLDADGDGLPDEWEEQYFADATAGDSAAISSNRVNTVYECYIAGLDPTDPNARFQISNFTPNHSESILRWQTASGRVYSVWFTTNLMSGFQCLGSNIPWTQTSFTNQTAAPSRFYKIGVEIEE